MSKNFNQLTIRAITGAVRLSTRHPWPVMLVFLLVAIVSAVYLPPQLAIS